MSERFAAVASRAQRLDGFAQTLEPVSTAGRYKVMQSIADNAVYATCDGSAWFKIFDSSGPAGGGGTLNAAYANGPAGNTISMTDALGAVTLSSGRTSGSILAITTTTIPAAITGAITAVSIDMSSLGVAGSVATTSLQAVSIAGPYSAVAKSATTGLVRISSAYRNAQAINVVVKNKQALAGSIIYVGWSISNYEGELGNSVLTDTTHVLTIDGQTNVSAGVHEFRGISILIPASSSSNTRGFSLNSLQTAGGMSLLVHDGGTLSGSIVGQRIALDNISGGLGNSVIGHLVGMPASTNSATCAYSVSTAQTAGALYHGLFSGATTLTGTIYGSDIDLATGVTPGAQIVVGSRVTIPASTNTATYGYNVVSTQQAGAFFYGRIAGPTTLLGQMIGIYIEMDDATGLVPNSSQLVGASIKTATGSNIGDRGINVECGARSASASCGAFVLSPASSSNANVITATSNANVTSSAGVDGNLFYGVMNAAGGRGVRVQTGSFTAASVGGLGIFYRTGTWSGGGTESIAMMQFVRDMTITGSPTLSAPILQVTSSPVNSSGTTTYSANEATITRSPTQSGGTLNLSGSILAVTHSPSLVTGTDTTTGVSISMSPNTSSNVAALSVTMGASSGSDAQAIGVVWGSLAGSINGIARINLSANGTTTTEQTMLHLRSITATYTLGEKLNGIICDVSTNIAPGVNRVIGASFIVGASSSANTRAIKIASTQTGAASVGVEIGMTPGSSASVIGQTITMGGNATGAALSIAHSGTNANQLAFTSAIDGTGSHIYGPTSAAFYLKAGQPTGTANGHDINLIGSNGSTSGTGGSIYLTGGNGAGGTNKGGDIVLTGGNPVSTGAYGYVIAATGAATNSSAVGNTGAATVTLNISLANVFTATSTGDTTWVFANPVTTGYVSCFTLVLTAGGSYVQTWPTEVKWPGGVAPVLSLTGVDVLTFFTSDGGTTWRGVLAQLDSK